jgi:uncharacterized protein (TIGR03435 family)
MRPLPILILLAAAAVAGTPTSPGQPEFEVASIKSISSKAAAGVGRGTRFRTTPSGSLIADNISVKQLIRYAYGLSDFQIAGGPRWIESARFNVLAKTETGLKAPTSDERLIQMRPMLQTMLAERFMLTVHRETKELPIYELVPAKSGIKIPRTKPETCIYCGYYRVGRTWITAEGISMPKLTAALTDALGREVIDHTEFTGTFDIDVEFAPNDLRAPTGQPVRDDSSAPSLFTVVQQELGLRLAGAKGPVEILTIDHIEQPSEN